VICQLRVLYRAVRPLEVSPARPGSKTSGDCRVERITSRLPPAAGRSYNPAHSCGDLRTAAAAGRLLVPVSSLPEQADIPHPFAPAPPARVRELLALYGEAGQASRDAVAGRDEVALAVRAPSQVLTRARVAMETRARSLGRLPVAIALFCSLY
jgi:hypothetical protein